MFPAVEINSTFHRSHRATTYARWAASVPPDFRFSVKLPRTITHDQRLSGTRGLVDDFLAEVAPLGTRLGCLLVQLPPSLEWSARGARTFFQSLRERFEGAVAVEPRHPTWFTPEAERALVAHRICRVVADPVRSPAGLQPGGWDGMAYYRLHGSPRIYYSSYSDDFLEHLAERLREHQRARVPCWCIFDNTTLGAGTGNAISMLQRVGRGIR